jgi:hypothetical protein
MLTVVRRCQLPQPLVTARLNQTFAALFHDLHAQLCFRVRRFAPCCLSGLRVAVALPGERYSAVENARYAQ